MHEALLEWITPSEEPCRVLAVACPALLASLLQRLPQAELVVPGTQPELEDARIRWCPEEPDSPELVFPRGSFAYIVAPGVFARMAAPETMARRFWEWLAPDGQLLTGFSNIRHWRILQELMTGHFRYGQNGIARDALHFFALPEIVRFFEGLHYHELQFLPYSEPSAEGMEARLAAAGFANVEEDLSTAIWYVRASRSTAAAGLLKKQFTPALRQELVYLLRRIENGIEPVENTERLLALCTERAVPMSYLARLAANALQAPKAALQRIAAVLEDGGKR